MRRSTSASVSLAVFCTFLWSSTLLAQGGLITFFDGSNLDQWNVIGDADWIIEGDVLEATGESGFLVSADSYEDFHLTLEFWTGPDANSGVFVRCSDAEDVGAANSYEVNIFDKRADQTYRTGGIVNFAEPTSIIDAADRWNTYEITAQGSRLLIELNGTIVVDIEDDTYAAGPFALQYGNGIVRFRDIQLREL